MKPFFYEINESDRKKINLFDVLFTILKDNRFLFSIDEQSVFNLNQYNTDDYEWRRDGIIIKNGDIVEEGNIIEYEANNKKPFELFFKKSNEVIYNLSLLINPYFHKILYIREFSTFFDKEDVSWNNVNLNKFLPTNVNHDKNWFRWKKGVYKKQEDERIVHPSFNVHNGVWYYGEIIDEIFLETLKINIVISPTIMEIVDDGKKIHTIEKDFGKYMINRKIDLNCHNKLSWIAYINLDIKNDPLQMIQHFEDEIISPLTIEYFNDYFSLFRNYIFFKNKGKEDTFALEIRQNIHFIRKHWNDKIDPIKKKIKDRDSNENPYYPILLVSNVLDEWMHNGDIREEFCDFLKNEFFSFSKPTVLTDCDIEKPLKEGTYVLRYTNNKKLNNINNIENNNTNTVHIPSFIDPLIDDVIQTNDYNDIYLAVFIIYYIKSKLYTIKSEREIDKLIEGYNKEDVNFTLSTGKNVETLHEGQQGFIYTKIPSTKTKFNDKFFGYFIKSINN